MGLIKELYSKKIFLDTAPLIYFMEEESEFLPLLSDLFSSSNNCRFVTSVITLSEVLVMPLREKRMQLVEQYKNILTLAGNIEIFDINIPIAEETAKIRANFHFKTPDAIQLATAKYSIADYFFTNDYRLKTFTDLNVITLTDL
ncbi:MAG: PIN domain-containing protein [Bacteroidetes bacterium]|nr:PIN domain-containing protein [Bacteroidota bacterium]